MPFKKPTDQIPGLAAGLLLFIALFALQLNNAFFNSSYQQKVIDHLDVYERIMASIEPTPPGSKNILFETAVKNSITQDLFNRNVKSLLDGLIDFVSGRTNKLPDLYIAGTGRLSMAASAGVPPAAVEKINLQLLMMFSDEQSFNNILSVISLVQFGLYYLPLFSMMLFAALVIAVSMRSSASILDWIDTAVLSFFTFSWLAAMIVGSAPWVLPPPEIPSEAAGRLLMDYVRYCTGAISENILLSGLILLIGQKIALYLYQHICKTSANTRITGISTGSKTFCSHMKNSSRLYPKRILSLLLVSTIIYSLLSLTLIEKAYGAYQKRNLGNAVSYIMGSISYNRYTDARNDDVCLLNVKILNGNTKTPVKDLEAAVFTLDAKDSMFNEKKKEKPEIVKKTDNNGTASFLLSEGDFRLELKPLGSPDLGYHDAVTALSYDFSLATPGRTDLVVTLGSDSAASNKTVTAASDKTETVASSKTGNAASGSTGTVAAGIGGVATVSAASGKAVTTSSDKTGTAASDNTDAATDNTGTAAADVGGVPADLKIVDASMQYIP
ncbi:MAG TPA: hypothetical protein VHT96_11235 [Clostridia bacterium]|nr:hypothetical protein [Clostridia bacterium]